MNDKLFCTHILILCCPHGISSSSFNCISSVLFGFLQNQASAFVILKTGSTCSAKFPVAVFACIHAMVSVGQHIYKTLWIALSLAEVLCTHWVYCNFLCNLMEGGMEGWSENLLGQLLCKTLVCLFLRTYKLFSRFLKNTFQTMHMLIIYDSCWCLSLNGFLDMYCSGSSSWTPFPLQWQEICFIKLGHIKLLFKKHPSFSLFRCSYIY